MSFTQEEIYEILSGLEGTSIEETTTRYEEELPETVIEFDRDSTSQSDRETVDMVASIEEGLTPEELNSLRSEARERLGLDESDSTENEEMEEIANNLLPIGEEEEVVETTARFSGAVWFEEIQNTDIILAGLGGIGSYVAFLLSRMQPNTIFMYDADKVEAVNMAGQFFTLENIGKYKVNAVAETIYNFSRYSNTVAIPEFYTSESDAGDIMICGFDNMVARKTFYYSWKNRLDKVPDTHRKNCLFIDGRLAAEKFQVFALTGDDVENMKIYEDTWLFDDSEAAETLCSYKQTTYMAHMIGSIMVNIFVNFIANKAGSPLPLDVPFITSYEGGFMLFDTSY